MVRPWAETTGFLRVERVGVSAGGNQDDAGFWEMPGDQSTPKRYDLPDGSRRSMEFPAHRQWILRNSTQPAGRRPNRVAGHGDGVRRPCQPSPASSSARRVTIYILNVSRDASSGTTPPKRSYRLLREMTLAKTRPLPSSTAAAVSSQEVSMPSVGPGRWGSGSGHAGESCPWVRVITGVIASGTSEMFGCAMIVWVGTARDQYAGGSHRSAR